MGPFWTLIGLSLPLHSFSELSLAPHEIQWQVENKSKREEEDPVWPLVEGKVIGILVVPLLLYWPAAFSETYLTHSDRPTI